MADNRSGLIGFAVLVLIFAAFAGLLLVSVSSDDDSSANQSVGSYEYSLDDVNKKAVVVKYTGKEADVGIPASVKFNTEEYKVVGIGEKAFINNNTMQSLTIPASVTDVASYAFYGCTKLEIVNLESGIETLGAHAFELCTSLKTIEFPDTLRYLGDSVFRYCSLITKIVFQANKYLTVLPQYSFADCVRLKEITLPSTIGTIGDYAFSGCTSLTTVLLPLDSNLKSIGNYAFYMCDSLTTYDFTASVFSIGDGAFGYCSSLNNIAFPYRLAKIGNIAFIGCKSLKSITIPSSVSSIGYGPFAQCNSLNLIGVESGSVYFTTFETALMDYDRTRVVQAPCSLTSISLPSTISSIESYSFAGCNKLTQITLSSSLSGIGNYAFMGCSALKSMHIRSAVSLIGEGVFINCDSLEEFTVDESSTDFRSVGGVLYSYNQKRLVKCPNQLEGVYNISSAVETIDASAFFGCSKITKFTTDPNNKYYSADEATGALYNKDYTYLVAYPAGSSADKFEIKASVNNINDYTFGYCKYLSQITISKGNEHYKSTDGILYSKSGTTLIYYPSAIKHSQFELPDYVSAVNSYAFFGCSALQNLKMTTAVVSFGLESISVGMYGNSCGFSVSGNTDRVFPSYAYNIYTNSPVPQQEDAGGISTVLLVFIGILIVVVILIVLFIRHKYSG